MVIEQSRVILIDEQGRNRGEMLSSEARRIADESGLDLVEVSRQADLSVCKILDRGKLNYEKKKQAKKNLKSKSSRGMKEMKFRVNIGQHDQTTKIGHIKRFLAKGHSVRIVVQLKGREKSNTSIGRAKLQELLETLPGKIDEVKQSGVKIVNISTTVHPGMSQIGSHV